MSNFCATAAAPKTLTISAAASVSGGKDAYFLATNCLKLDSWHCSGQGARFRQRVRKDKKRKKIRGEKNLLSPYEGRLQNPALRRYKCHARLTLSDSCRCCHLPCSRSSCSPS